MHTILEVFSNHVLIAALIGWFVAQGLKIPIHYLVEHEWDLSRLHGSGGMPSSHTAMVVSAAVMVGALNGYASGVFAVMVVVALIVMYDATGGKQAARPRSSIRFCRMCLSTASPSPMPSSRSWWATSPSRWPAARWWAWRWQESIS